MKITELNRLNQIDIEIKIALDEMMAGDINATMPAGDKIRALKIERLKIMGAK